MTLEFKETDWQGENNNYVNLIEFKESLSDKPLLQVFKYLDDNHTAVNLVQNISINYIEGSKSIVIAYNEKFNGYLVVR